MSIGGLHLAPIGPNPENILDIATGTDADVEVLYALGLTISRYWTMGDRVWYA
jgi:hypothetical protein